MTTLSNHAHAAKLIRQELKKHGVAGRVRAKSYTGGESVTVTLENAAPWTVKAVERFAAKFEYGHFDGMRDIYEYSNRRDDIPQVKFLFVQNRIDDEIRQAAYEYLRGYWSGYDQLPENYTEAQNMRAPSGNYWVSDEVHQVLNGSMGQFWKKPRVRAEVAA